MDQLVNVPSAIKAHTVPQRALDCGPCLCGLNQIYDRCHHSIKDHLQLEIYTCVQTYSGFSIDIAKLFIVCWIFL